jgi:hypothetical protein
VIIFTVFVLINKKTLQQVTFKMTALDDFDDLAILFSGLPSETDDSSVSTISTSSSTKSSSGRKRIYDSNELKEKNKEWCTQSRRRRKILVAEVVAFCKEELRTLSQGFLKLETDINQPNVVEILAGRVKNLQTVFDEMQFH